MRHQLHQPRIDQDPRTNTVKHPIDQQRGLTPGGIRLPHTQAYGDGNRRRESVRQREEVWGPAFGIRPGGGCEAGSETEAFEGLVEDEDDVESDELGAGDGEGEADEDGVEDDAEFEDEDGGHLGAVVFKGEGVEVFLIVRVAGGGFGLGERVVLVVIFAGGFDVVVVGVIAHVAQVVLSRGVAMGWMRRGGGGEFAFGGVVVGVGVGVEIIA